MPSRPLQGARLGWPPRGVAFDGGGGGRPRRGAERSAWGEVVRSERQLAERGI